MHKLLLLRKKQSNEQVKSIFEQFDFPLLNLCYKMLSIFEHNSPKSNNLKHFNITELPFINLRRKKKHKILLKNSCFERDGEVHLKSFCCSCFKSWFVGIVGLKSPQNVTSTSNCLYLLQCHWSEMSDLAVMAYAAPRTRMHSNPSVHLECFGKFFGLSLRKHLQHGHHYMTNVQFTLINSFRSI